MNENIIDELQSSIIHAYLISYCTTYYSLEILNHSLFYSIKTEVDQFSITIIRSNNWKKKCFFLVLKKIQTNKQQEKNKRYNMVNSKCLPRKF